MEAKERCITDRHLRIITPQLEEATKRDDVARALESEGESMRDLTQEILNITTISPECPVDMKDFLVAKRTLLEAGYRLAVSQKALQKTFKPVKDWHKEYEGLKYRNKHHSNPRLKQWFNTEMKRIAERREHLGKYNTLEDIERAEQQCKASYERCKADREDLLKRTAQKLQEALDTHDKSVLKVRELQENFDSIDDGLMLDAFNKYAGDLDSVACEIHEEEMHAASGATCEVCKMRWFYKMDACLSHEDVCEGPLTASELGKYKKKVSGVPGYRNPLNGYYIFGTRKCSMCGEFKDKDDFSEAEEKKRADKRVCYACMNDRSTEK